MVKTSAAAARKKARPEENTKTCASASVSAADASAHRYPLRSRSTRSTSAKSQTQGAKPRTTQPRTRADSSSLAATLPKAVTPASAAPRPRQLYFGDESAIPPLFSHGTPACRCPRVCNFQTLTGFDYLKHYGGDVLQYLDERESKEHGGLLPSSHSSTHQQGSRHDSSTISSPVSTSRKDEKSYASSPSSSDDDDSTVAGPVTPRPDTVISTKARIRNGDKSMRHLEEPTEKLERQPNVNQRMRAVLVSWLIEVSIEYNVSMAAYHLAISLLDKVLDCGPTTGERIAWLSDDSDYEEDEMDWPNKWFVVSRSEFQALGWYVFVAENTV